MVWQFMVYLCWLYFISYSANLHVKLTYLVVRYITYYNFGLAVHHPTVVFQIQDKHNIIFALDRLQIQSVLTVFMVN